MFKNETNTVGACKTTEVSTYRLLCYKVIRKGRAKVVKCAVISLCYAKRSFIFSQSS